MATFRRAKVVEVIERSEGICRARLALDDGEIVAAGFPGMLGPLSPGDAVIVNTTAIDLDLGTGGEGFILWNLDGTGPPGPGEGHIVKIRYTPWQTEVLAAEAPESPDHDRLRNADSIAGVPVVACSLHSQIAGVAAGIKATRPGARVGYLMTDGAALPIAWSKLVDSLKNAELIDATCTAGHAFGGDIEAVNIFSGMAGLVHARSADVVVAAMGPGVVGTGTALGFTALEQGQLLDAATALEARSIACLRISFADARPRHAGVSHHTITALKVAAREPSLLVLPELPGEAHTDLRRQLEAAGLTQRHEITTADGAPGLELLASRGVAVSSMGRSVDEVPELFLAASAAGRVAADHL
jgi:hypothetical protein